MKKILSIIAAFIALSLFAACQPAEEDSTPIDSPSPSASPSQEVSPSPEPDPGPDDSDYFKFTRENFPVIDGSTSMVPLAQAVASVLLGESREDVSELMSFNRTTTAFRLLYGGQCDILIVGEPNVSVYEEMGQAGFKYEQATIAHDALIFVVNEDNPVSNLSTDEIYRIYTGEITNWAQLGGDDVEIVAFQRNEDAGSQSLMNRLVMRGSHMMEAPIGQIAGEMGALMEYVKSYEDSAAAIGYSVYYYANDMKMAEGLKIISVDGIEPSAETIRDGSYPHISEYYTVIAADEAQDSPARMMYDWLQGDEGQRLISDQGYVSVLDF